MKILVTGTDGLIGRAMLNHFFAQPDVLVIGCLRTGVSDEASRRIVNAMVPQ